MNKLCELSWVFLSYIELLMSSLNFYAHNYQSEGEVFKFGHTCVLIHVQDSEFEGMCPWDIDDAPSCININHYKALRINFITFG